MFAVSATRSQDLTFDALGLHLDISRQLISAELWSQLIDAASESGIISKIEQMSGGAIVNVTEGRAALHTALRAEPSTSADASWASHEIHRAMELARLIRKDQDIHTVVNIGIGGSDLGPAMAVRALRRFCDGPEVRFVSNVDAANLDNALQGLHPRNTVFIVSSKTFTTSETMHNASRAQAWITAGGVSWKDHFYASTANPAAAHDWGISADKCLEFKEWVGGRFSISSVIGFPLMCAVGSDAFAEFLRGMREMDSHVAKSPLHQNLAVAHALVWFANTGLHQFPSVAVIPYSHDLARLPAYLQQLVMESNGKSVTIDGKNSTNPTGPVVWGEPGSNGQHAFFQMLHQGTQVVPVEFIGTVAPLGSDQSAHDILIANLLAQSEALAVGARAENPHKNFPGNRPSTVLMMDELTPYSLGVLLSMYEHSTAIQGWLMGINSFDQFGVELGKTIAGRVAMAISDSSQSSELTVTHPLLQWYLQKRNNKSSQ